MPHRDSLQVPGMNEIEQSRQATRFRHNPKLTENGGMNFSANHCLVQILVETEEWVSTLHSRCYRIGCATAT